MAVMDTFATFMSDRGISVDVSVLPDVETLSAALDKIDSWFWSLSAAVREGYDEATGEEALSVMLAAPEINVAPEVSGLLEAFDASSGQTLSAMVSGSRDCLNRAIAQESGVA